MDVEFTIPLKKDDLLEKGDGTSYRLTELLDVDESFSRLSGVKKIIADFGCEGIFECFDPAFSILYNSDELTLFKLHELCDNVLFKFLKLLQKYVEKSISDTNENKMLSCNAVKMITYLASMFIKAYEDKLTMQSENFMAEPKKGRGKVRKADEFWDWGCKKVEFIQLLKGVMMMDIFKLWEPPVVEESFVNLVAGCCFKLFENTEIGLVKSKPLREATASLIAVLANQYNYGLTFILKAVHILKSSEHCVSPLSSTIQLLVREHGHSTVLPKLLRELADMVQDDEGGLSKNVSLLIIDLAECDASLLLPSVKILFKYLTFPNYSLRISILVSMCEILLRSSPETMNEDMKGNRDKMLKALRNHIRDENSYVRSKVLQLWIKLTIAQCVPKHTVLPLLRTTLHRITDKSSHVSKNAISLFTRVLQSNPYAGKLVLPDLKEQLEKEKAGLKQLTRKRESLPEEIWSDLEPELIVCLSKLVDLESPESMGAADGISIQEVLIVLSKLIRERCFPEAFLLLKQTEAQFPEATEIRCSRKEDVSIVEYYVSVFKKVFFTAPDVSTQAAALDLDSCVQDYEKQKAVVDYTKECIAFVEVIHEAGEKILNILFGKGTLEVVESVEFFTTAFQFGVAQAKEAVRDMLYLMRSRAPGIREAVAGAYKTLYLSTNKNNPKAQAHVISNRLIKLIKELKSDQRTSLEELIQEWFKTNNLDNVFITVLWERVSGKIPDCSTQDTEAAFLLLFIISKFTPMLVASNIKVLITCGLENPVSLKVVALTCNMLASTASVKNKNKLVRYHKDHEVIALPTGLVVKYFDDMHKPSYLTMTAAVVDLIFSLCPDPDIAVDDLLSKLYIRFITLSERSKDESINKDTLEAMKVNQDVLGRLIWIYGHVKFRTWRYLDKTVFNSLKKTGGDEESKEKPKVEQEVDELEAETELAADEALLDGITKSCDALLSSGSLNIILRDLVISVCLGLGQTVSPKLKSVAAVSLSKLMMVSQPFCEEHINLFVTLMEKSPEENVRGNLISGFGDMICRFPNVVEPWTPYLFARLKDQSTEVRYTTVSVLAHLITKEMVKVRSQMSEVALCLEDPDPRISEKVRFLLIDLSQKGNTLYNVIPDIISSLSNPERPEPLSHETFTSIIKFILSLVTKERQHELLVEKLCVRLKEVSDNERQATDLAFCLSQLRYSEKSLRALQEALPTFTDKLSFESVYNTILNILQSAHKSTKPNCKELAGEGLNKLEELVGGEIIREEGTEDPESQPPGSLLESVRKDRLSRVGKTPGRNPPKSAKPSARKRAPKTPKASQHLEEDLSPTFREPRRARRPRKILQESSSDESD